jgi:predicted O-linked N-acetylglucosamine transferase (SPINDLY family)
MRERPVPVSADLSEAIALAQNGRFSDALGLLQPYCAKHPTDENGLFFLGACAEQLGQKQIAMDAYHRCIALEGRNAIACNNLGRLLQMAGDRVGAEDCYRRALTVAPDHPQANYNLGLLLITGNRNLEALPFLSATARLLPAVARVHFDLAQTLKGLNRQTEAEAAVKRALSIDPNSAPAWNLLGTIHQVNHALDDAMNCYRRALTIDTRHAEALGNLGSALLVQGDVLAAVAAFDRAIALKPDWAGLHSNRLLALNYYSEDGEQNLAAHTAWTRRTRVATSQAQRPRAAEPERRLRVGYVSPDFRAHSVGWFLNGILAHHDHLAFEVFCYSDCASPDTVTVRLRSFSDHWCDTAGMEDRVLADQIVTDRIDILVDLAGHTANNRLPVFASKPAPVQVSYLGYPNTTGLDAMDYRLTDAVADPPGATEAFHTETLVRLPHGFLCFTPPSQDIDLYPPPILKNGFITFGSFNMLAKVTPEVVRCWAKLLREIPGSRLHLKAFGLGGAGTRTRIVALFGLNGIGEERLSLYGLANSLGSHLEHYHAVDIALDTFPYNGTTTTCEALWMGVPVVTVAGRLHAGRVGASLLTRIGCTEFIAADLTGYMQLARALAHDPERLTLYRGTLRPRLVASPLCDARAFTCGLEQAYQTMWRGYCALSQP